MNELYYTKMGERAKKGGILSLKNYLSHAPQEGQAIRKLESTLIFQQSTDLFYHGHQVGLNARMTRLRGSLVEHACR
jgi:hypothetical protein